MAAIYINGKLCSGGTELVEEVQEGLTEAVTSDAVARYIKPVVQNVTSGVTNPVSSGAVYGALTNLESGLTNKYSQILTPTHYAQATYKFYLHNYKGKCVLITFMNTTSGHTIEAVVYVSQYGLYPTVLHNGGASVNLDSQDTFGLFVADSGYNEGSLCMAWGIVL